MYVSYGPTCISYLDVNDVKSFFLYSLEHHMSSCIKILVVHCTVIVLVGVTGNLID